jgi:hypothetical protein
MPTVDPHTFEMGVHRVSYSETKTQPCVEISTDSGAKLSCSTSAPLLGRIAPVLAGDLAVGDEIAVQVDDGFGYATVESVSQLGDRKVRHITCGNQYFLAGCGNGKYILHHNIKANRETGKDLYGLQQNIMDMAGSGPVHGGGVDATSNTRGAMQANGSWYNIPGNGPNPSAQPGAWNGQLIDPTYSGEAAPAAPGTSAPNPWGSVGGVGNYSPPNFSSSMPPPMPAHAPSGNPTAGSGVVNWVDNHMGNFYDENSGKVNKLNTALGALGMITGLPIQRGAMAVSKSHLMNGSGGDWARTQMQQQYDRSNPQQREQFINSTAEKYKTTPDNVRQIIGRP